MTKVHRIVGIIFTLLGLYISIYSFTKLEVGTITKPGAGFFTFVCGTGIFISSAIWLFLSWRKKGDSTPFWGKGEWINLLLALVITFVYALVMEPLGYAISTALFILLWQIVIAHSKPLTIILFTVLGTGAMYFLFEKLLSVPLPNGLLPW